jgi:hypothetical protein
VSEEAAQPVEGQGAEAPEGNDLYTAFLDGVPTDIHEQVIPALKAQDAEFTKRFQSLSEKTKPFDEIGIFDRDAEEVASYMQLAQALESAQQGDEQAQAAIYEWWDSVGDTMGFYEAGGEGEEDNSLSLDEDFDPYNRDQLSKLLADQVAQQVGPIAELIQQQQMTQQEQQALAEAEAEVEVQIEELRGQHDLSDDVLGEILELAEMFVESDNPIQAGFEKYQSLVGKGEANLFNDKVQQPNTPEGSGPAATSPDPVTSANVKDKVLERLNQQKSLTG